MKTWAAWPAGTAAATPELRWGNEGAELRSFGGRSEACGKAGGRRSHVGLIEGGACSAVGGKKRFLSDAERVIYLYNLFFFSFRGLGKNFVGGLTIALRTAAATQDSQTGSARPTSCRRQFYRCSSSNPWQTRGGEYYVLIFVRSSIRDSVTGNSKHLDLG